MIVSYRSKKERHESRVWLHELIREQKDFLGEALNKDISDLQGIRNTFHLSRPRNVLSLKAAEDSFDVVLKVTDKIQKEESKKRR